MTLTKSALLAALAGLPDDTEVVLDIGDSQGFVVIDVEVDDLGDGAHGVRVLPARDDAEAQQLVALVQRGL